MHSAACVSLDCKRGLCMRSCVKESRNLPISCWAGVRRGQNLFSVTNTLRYVLKPWLLGEAGELCASFCSQPEICMWMSQEGLWQKNSATDEYFQSHNCQSVFVDAKGCNSSSGLSLLLHQNECDSFCS